MKLASLNEVLRSGKSFLGSHMKSKYRNKEVGVPLTNTRPPNSSGSSMIPNRIVIKNKKTLTRRRNRGWRRLISFVRSRRHTTPRFQIVSVD